MRQNRSSVVAAPPPLDRVPKWTEPFSWADVWRRPSGPATAETAFLCASSSGELALDKSVANDWEESRRLPVGIGLRDPRSQKRDLGHPSSIAQARASSFLSRLPSASRLALP